MATTVRWLAGGLASVPHGEVWLSPLEVERLSRMRFTKRADEFLVSRATSKRAIARVVGLDAHDVEVLRRVEVRHKPTGAPTPFVDGRPAGLAMSSTDRADHAVSVVTDRTEVAVGCDLELVEERSSGFVESYLTEVEQQLVAGAAEKALVANLLWSAKESALKVLETGLRRDTRTVEVQLDLGASGGAADASGWSPLTVRPTEGGTLHGWWLQAGSFLLSVVASAPIAVPVALGDPDGLARAEPTHRWIDDPVRRVPAPGST